MADDEHVGPWWVGLVQCRICSHNQVSVVPVESYDCDDPDNLECSNCGNMTCDPVETDDNE